MKKLLVYSTLVLMATIVILVLVNADLSHAQMMMSATHIESAERHMNQNSHPNYDEDMSMCPMNVAQHMHRNMHDECKEMHENMNETDSRNICTTLCRKD